MTPTGAIASLHVLRTVRSWVLPITRNVAPSARAVLPVQLSPHGDEPCPLT